MKTCNYCGSFSLQKTIGGSEPHYGKLTCNDCGRWVCWLTNPEKITMQLRRTDFIRGLLLHSGLSAWERTFLQNIQAKRWLTPRQKQKFDQISLRVNGAVFTYENTPSRGSGRGADAVTVGSDGS